MLPILFTIPRISLGPIAFGPIPVHSFGVVMVIAFLAAVWIVRRRAPKYGIDPNKISDACFWALVSGILGARIVFIVQELPYYLQHTRELFSLQFEGLTSFGGLAFAILALWVWAVRQKVPVARLFDLCAPGFLLGSAIGRFGCLLNGCCYGVVCPDTFPLATHFAGVPFAHQPAQIYDAAMDFVGLFLLLRLTRLPLRAGQPAAFGAFAYAMARFIYEFFRAGTDEQVRQGIASSTRIPGIFLTEAQVAALIMMVIAGAWWLMASKRVPSRPESTEGEQRVSGKALQSDPADCLTSV